MSKNKYIEFSYNLGRFNLDKLLEQGERIKRAVEFSDNKYIKSVRTDPTFCSVDSDHEGKYPGFTVKLESQYISHLGSALRDFIEIAGIPSMVVEDSDEDLTERVLNEFGYTAPISKLLGLNIGLEKFTGGRRLKELATGKPVYAPS